MRDENITWFRIFINAAYFMTGKNYFMNKHVARML